MSFKNRGRVASRKGQSSAESERSLRQKATMQYLVDSDSDEEGGRQNFSLEDKLASTRFPQYLQYFIKELQGSQVNLAYFQRHGFNTPILVKEKSGLEITVPDPGFTVTDVRDWVGPKRVVDIMDCATQKNSEMTMKEWDEYYYSENRTRKLNVISLEFSYTKMETLVQSPKVIRQIDWTDNIWPRHFKEMQTEGTNDMRSMMYPKVQKYCLMSVKGCYTDFHIDFGGTSVWYHILRGKKVFWLVPPTENNLKTYENWTLSGRQGDVFFGDIVDKCGMITLEAGNTFFIPSGWIHAVYTPEDSLVFGGNFLHSFAIEKQIRVAQIEEMTKVPQKFRFPFFTELQWYALDKYVYALLGRTHLEFSDEEQCLLLGSEDERTQHLESLEQHHRHVTAQEIFGIKAIIMYIHALPVSKKNVPPLLKEPINLVRDIKLVVEGHKNDDPDKSVTGQPLLHWPGIKNEKGFAKLKSKMKRKSDNLYSPIKSEKVRKPVRIPCKICQACIRPDCATCLHCRDMIRYGGPGRLRLPCQLRKCVQPLLPLSVVCNICALDGWYAEPSMRLVDRPPGTCALMECIFCEEVVHPTCVTDYGVDGFIRMDLPNSWECPKCIKSKQDSESNTSSSGPSPNKSIKTEVELETNIKKPVSTGSDTNLICGSYELFSVKGKSDQPKHELRTQLAEQILAASSQETRQAKYVFRPAALKEDAEPLFKMSLNELKMQRMIMLPVFQKLPITDLCHCALVCKSWSQILQDPSLWSKVKFEHWKITSHILSLIVQRQPIHLALDFCTISKQQLNWLLPRIPQTRGLSLQGIDYPSCVLALASVNTPMLQELDLSFVTGLNDGALFKILSSPRDSRPGLLDKKSRLKLLRSLDLSHTEITDVGLRYIAQYLGQLSDLKLTKCWKVTDAGLAQLSSLENLNKLDLSSCKMVSNQGLMHIIKCKNIIHLDCTNTSVDKEGLKKFIDGSDEKLKLYGQVVSKRQSGKKKK